VTQKNLFELCQLQVTIWHCNIL